MPAPGLVVDATVVLAVPSPQFTLTVNVMSSGSEAVTVHELATVALKEVGTSTIVMSGALLGGSMDTATLSEALFALPTPKHCTVYIIRDGPLTLLTIEPVGGKYISSMRHRPAFVDVHERLILLFVGTEAISAIPFTRKSTETPDTLHPEKVVFGPSKYRYSSTLSDEVSVPSILTSARLNSLGVDTEGFAAKTRIFSISDDEITRSPFTSPSVPHGSVLFTPEYVLMIEKKESLVSVGD